MKARDELIVGKHDIGYMSAKLISEYGDQEIAPKQVGPYRKLPRYMTDKEIEAELKPDMCDMGDVLAFLENPPEGTKDGYYNLFYTPAFVVSVFWDDTDWRVYAWFRGDDGWFVVYRVFSPATASSGTVASSDSVALGTLVLGQKVQKIGGDYTFKGTVVAVFKKTSGQVRLVVENGEGVLHIYSEKNLERV